MAKRRRGRMGSLGDRAFQQTDEELENQEVEVLLQTAIQWDEFRPEIEDEEVYDLLIAEVQAATDKNEDLAQLKSRIKTLGTEGLQVARKVIELAT